MLLPFEWDAVAAAEDAVAAEEAVAALEEGTGRARSRLPPEAPTPLCGRLLLLWPWPTEAALAGRAAALL